MFLRLLKILIGVLIFLLVTIGIGLYIMNAKKTGPSGVSTAGWKTYSSPQHKFSFMYPDTVKISEDLYGFLLLQYSEPFVSPTLNDKNPVSPGFFIDMISTSSAGQSLKDIVEKRIEQAKANGKTITQPSTEIKVGSYSGFVFSATRKIKSTYIFLQKDIKTYGAIAYSLNDRNNKGYQNEINAIIASFRFTQ